MFDHRVIEILERIDHTLEVLLRVAEHEVQLLQKIDRALTPPVLQSSGATVTVISP
jgi:hypothetical protein